MDFVDLLPQLLGDVAGCPDITATNALLNASIDFLGFTEAWNVVLAPIPLVDNQPGYAITPPTQGRTSGILSVRAPWRPLIPKTMDQLDRESPGWPALLSSNPMFYNVSPDNSTLTVYPTPLGAQSAPITIRAAFVPLLTATSIPDYIANDHFEALLNGARYRLMLMSGRAWSNAQLGAYFKTQFNEDKVLARIDVLHEQTKANLTVYAPPFGLG